LITKLKQFSFYNRKHHLFKRWCFLLCSSDPYRSTSRTFENAAIEKLIDASKSREAKTLAKLIEATKTPDADIEPTSAWKLGTGGPSSNLETGVTLN